MEPRTRTILLDLSWTPILICLLGSLRQTNVWSGVGGTGRLNIQTSTLMPGNHELVTRCMCNSYWRVISPDLLLMAGLYMSSTRWEAQLQPYPEDGICSNSDFSFPAIELLLKLITCPVLGHCEKSTVCYTVELLLVYTIMDSLTAVLSFQEH